MMGISNQDLVFKLKSIGVRVEGDDAHIDTDIISAILQGKKLPHPREVILRDEPAAPESPAAARRRAPAPPPVRRPAANPLRPNRPRTLIQKVEPRIQTLPASERQAPAGAPLGAFSGGGFSTAGAGAAAHPLTTAGGAGAAMSAAGAGLGSSGFAPSHLHAAGDAGTPGRRLGGSARAARRAYGRRRDGDRRLPRSPLARGGRRRPRGAVPRLAGLPWLPSRARGPSAGQSLSWRRPGHA